jgi:hypothetical protein
MQFMHDRYSDTLDHPRTLLPTNELTDFGRNLYELERRAKRPYSLTNVLRSMCETPPRLGALETEVDQELRSLNRARNIVGRLVPLEVLSPLRRDLSITSPSTGAVTVQTTVGDQVIPFLRAKTVCGRLGATIIDGLTNGNVKLPRATVGGTASWSDTRLLFVAQRTVEPSDLRADARFVLNKKEARTLALARSGPCS